MAKNIVVFADGTGQEGGVGNNTNVYDLFNMIEDRTERQVTFYDRGLGTGWRKITGNIGGGGISRNVQECYDFISNSYNAGDQIYLFGFSRGATTVRTLAAFIHRFGILPKSRPELIKRAYKIYKTRGKEKRRRKVKKFLQRNHTMWCRIRFLGVWDTVAALGIPFKLVDILVDQISLFHHSFHDLRLSKSVDFARHALAVDDERITFHPTLWDEREDRDEDQQHKRVTSEISANDITDVHLVATKLKVAADPVSKRLTEKGLTFSVVDSQRLGSLVPKLRDAQDNVSKFVMGQFSRETQHAISDDKAPHNQRINALLAGLNQILCGDTIYDEARFAGKELREKTVELMSQNPRGTQLVYLNRLLLEDAYSDEIPKVEDKSRVPDRTRKLIDAFGSHLPGGRRDVDKERIEELKTALAHEFNVAIKGESLYDPQQAEMFDGLELSKETKDLIEQNKQSPSAVQRLNRLLLEDNYYLKPAIPPRVKQVWFAGMHTDVGGGYPANELARIPLVWMVKEAMDAGLLIYEKHKVDLRPDARGKMHNSREKLARFYRRRVRSWDPHKNQGKPPNVHESVLIRYRCEEDYEPWILKRKCQVDYWPKRLMSSVQFDNYYIWREGVWGFDSAFAVPWSSVERITFDEFERTITLHIRKDKVPIVIRGSLPKGTPDIASAFDSYKLAEADADLLRRDSQQQKWLDKLHKQDDEHTKKIDKLNELLSSFQIGEANREELDPETHPGTPKPK